MGGKSTFCDEIPDNHNMEQEEEHLIGHEGRKRPARQEQHRVSF